MATDQTPGWLSAAVTAGLGAIGIFGAWMRSVFVTTRQVSAAIKEVEQRFETKVTELERRLEAKVEEVKETVSNVQTTIVGLHEDNKHARHRLRGDLHNPMLRIAAGFEALKDELARQRREAELQREFEQKKAAAPANREPKS